MLFMPALAAIKGPIVLPQSESFLTINSYIGTPHLSAITLMIA
jgi:hypothetical protein